MKGLIGRILQKAQVSVLLLHSYPVEWVVIRFIWLVFLVVLLALAITAPLAGWGTNSSDLEYSLKWEMSIVCVLLLAPAYVIRRAATNSRSWAYWIFGFNYMLYMWWMGAVISLVGTIGVSGFVIFSREGSYFCLFLLVGVSSSALVVLRPRRQDLTSLAHHSEWKKNP